METRYVWLATHHRPEFKAKPICVKQFTAISVPLQSKRQQFENLEVGVVADLGL